MNYRAPVYQLSYFYSTISQGRRLQNVVAACLYIVCRRERCAHMLIDFADALQTDLHALGACFVKFARTLSLDLPQVDPSLYIHRFAAKLNLGKQHHAVAMTALRLVSRMKRDWMQTGRRPEGICAASLLLAARVHGFPMTRHEVSATLRVADITLRNRLAEFGNTPASSLTPQEFNRISDLPQNGNHDDTEDHTVPPSFIRGRLTEQRQLQIQEEARHRLSLSDSELAQQPHLLNISEVDTSNLKPGVKQALENSHMLNDEELMALANRQGLLEDSKGSLQTGDTASSTALTTVPPNVREAVLSSALMNTSWAMPVSYAKEASSFNSTQQKERQDRYLSRRNRYDAVEEACREKYGCYPVELNLDEYETLVQSICKETHKRGLSHYRPSSKNSLHIDPKVMEAAENLLISLPDGEFDPRDDSSIKEQESVWEKACELAEKGTTRLFKETDSDEDIHSDAWLQEEGFEEEDETILDQLQQDLSIRLVNNELTNFSSHVDEENDKTSVYISIAKRLASSQQNGTNKDDVHRDATERRLLIPVRSENTQFGGPIVHAESLTQKEIADLANFDYTTEGNSMQETGETFSDVDDDEVENALVDEEEAKHRGEIWLKMNSDYLEEQRKKQQEAPSKNTRGKHKKGKNTQQSTQRQGSHTDKQAAKSSTECKTTSKKLNYQALQNMDAFVEPASSSTIQGGPSVTYKKASNSRKRGPECLAEELSGRNSKSAHLDNGSQDVAEITQPALYPGVDALDSESDDEEQQERSELRSTLGLHNDNSDSEPEF